MRRSTGDVELLKLAVLHDPLVGAICSPEEVWQMVDEMLVAQAEWLPQYADAIPAAKKRLEQSKRRDARVGRRGAAKARAREDARERAATTGGRRGREAAG